ncbi:MAG TPA: AlpA family transcriptional regulator [Terracidiphilus sp.]|nr:AlpA family transcriptional regulator [Terracidiphilus sp.]
MPVTPASINILRLPQVKIRTGRCRASIYAMVAAGQFPPPIGIGGRSVGWIEAEIDEWLAARIAESRPPGPARSKPQAA